jgi:hypothetical protein
MSHDALRTWIEWLVDDRIGRAFQAHTSDAVGMGGGLSPRDSSQGPADSKPRWPLLHARLETQVRDLAGAQVRLEQRLERIQADLANVGSACHELKTWHCDDQEDVSKALRGALQSHQEEFGTYMEKLSVELRTETRSALRYEQ